MSPWTKILFQGIILDAKHTNIRNIILNRIFEAFEANENTYDTALVIIKIGLKPMVSVMIYGR